MPSQLVVKSTRRLPLWTAALVLLAVCGSGHAIAATPSAELKPVQLNMPLIKKIASVNHNLKEFEKAHPEAKLKDDIDISNEAKLKAGLNTLEREPYKSLFTRAGTNPREYLATLFTILNAGLGAYMVQQQGDDAWTKLKQSEDSLGLANIRFALDHQKELEALMDDSSGSHEGDDQESTTAPSDRAPHWQLPSSTRPQG